LAATLDDFEATELKLLEMEEAAETALADALAADALWCGNRQVAVSATHASATRPSQHPSLTSPTQTEPKRTS
jgi:hypothetical protein